MNEKEFEILFKENIGQLCNVANSLVKDADTAKDIVQQVFLKLWTKRDSLKIEGVPGAYLYRSVINASLNHIKKEKATNFKELSDNEFNKIDEIHDDKTEERLVAVKKAVMDLPPQCQVVFSLSRYEGLSNKKIAENLGVSVKAVEKHLSKAMKTLREKLLPIITAFLFIFLSKGG